MTPEERSLLESALKIAKENKAILEKLDRRARLGTIAKVFYWVVIIGLFFGAFYFIQPYIDFVKGLGGNGDTKTKSTLTQDYTEQLQELLR